MAYTSALVAQASTPTALTIAPALHVQYTNRANSTPGGSDSAGGHPPPRAAGAGAQRLVGWRTAGRAHADSAPLDAEGRAAITTRPTRGPATAASTTTIKWTMRPRRAARTRSATCLATTAGCRQARPAGWGSKGRRSLPSPALLYTRSWLMRCKAHEPAPAAGVLSVVSTAESSCCRAG